MIGEDIPFPELPMQWTIGREEWNGGDSKWFGLNKVTGQETVRFKSYGEALRAVESKEWMKW